MTENQKLREALQAAIVLFGHKCHDDCTKLTWLERAKLALAMQTDVPETNFGKIREALLAYHRATTFNERLLASAKADEALALPTVEQVDDINVAESFTSVTKTAAPVGERELPPVIAYRLDYPAAEGVGLPRFFGADDGERAHTFAFNHKATITELCARAALSAGDAVDAQRYRWLREQSDDDFVFAVVKNPHFDVYESPEELDAAIDASMRKGQL